MMNLRDRYHNDPQFSRLVDVMRAYIEAGSFTPTEIREAAMLAQIEYESRNPRPLTFTLDDVAKGKV